jgi:ATP-dependent Clp protease ATP-binding subunit ClpX
LPVIATLEELSEDALMQILTEPKNALTKQYQKLFGMEGVDLEFRPEALRAVARQGHGAQDRRTGLRSILEGVLLQPCTTCRLRKACRVWWLTRKTITGDAEPLLIYENPEPTPKAMPE